MIADAKILIIETSGRAGQVALALGPQLLEARRLDEARRHARDLVPQLADLLSRQKLTAKDLDAVFVSRGPGSYTGLRVGIMSAKAFAFATGCKLLAIDTFAAIALQGPAEAELIDVLADAQQERVYVQRFRRGEAGLPIAETPLRITALRDWLQAITPEVTATGPALHVHQGKLQAPITSPDSWDPQPASLLRLGLARLHAGKQDDLWKVEPLYLRPSSAEEKWNSLGKQRNTAQEPRTQ